MVVVLTDEITPTQPAVRKVFICQNGDCAEKDRAKALFERLLELRASLQLDDPNVPGYFKCNLAGCLNVCKDGPILAIQPDQALYRCSTEADLDRIFEQHILRNQPVTDLATRRKDA